MPPSSLTYVRPDDPATDLALRDVVVQSLFFDAAYWETYVARVGPENLRALRQDDATVASLAVYRTGQWFGGRQISMGGIAAVGVVPEARGGGAAAMIMSELLRELYEDGTAISTLFASTHTLYRRVGYEQSGNRVLYELPLSDIGIVDRGLPLTPVSLDDPTVLAELADRRAGRTAGNLVRTDGLWDRLVNVPGHTVYGYLLGPVSAPEGYLVYYQPNDWSRPVRLTIRDMLAETPAATRLLWTMIRDHRSVVDSVRWYGPASEPLLLGPVERDLKIVEPGGWMTRIVNVSGALEARGYPDGVSGELHLEIVGDEIIPQNNSRLILNVADGRGHVTSGGNAALTIDIRTLAPLFTGLFTASDLAVSGQLAADQAALAQADRIFSGPEPWMPEGF